MPDLSIPEIDDQDAFDCLVGFDVRGLGGFAEIR